MPYYKHCLTSTPYEMDVSDLTLNFDLSIVTVTSCPYAHAVVIWCDCVGGIQWRKDSLPCRGPVVPHPAAGGGAETQETYQPSLCHRDVSVHS